MKYIRNRDRDRKVPWTNGKGRICSLPLVAWRLNQPNGPFLMGKNHHHWKLTLKIAGPWCRSECITFYTCHVVDTFRTCLYQPRRCSTSQ